jgi:hypothetical protein
MRSLTILGEPVIYLPPSLRPLEDWFIEHRDEVKSLVGRPSGDLTVS